MGERALAAVSRPPDSLELFRSQWAGRESVVSRVLDGGDPLGVLLEEDWSWRGSLLPLHLLWTCDYQATTVLYIVSATGVEVYVPLWFGLPLLDNDPDPKLGAVVNVSSMTEFRELRLCFARLKGTLQESVLAGILSRKQLFQVLLVKLDDFPYRASPPLSRGPR